MSHLTIRLTPRLRFSSAGLVEYLIMLPLNLIPLVGTAIFLILQGRKNGPIYHARYFQLKGFNEAQKDAFVKQHHGGYIACVPTTRTYLILSSS